LHADKSKTPTEILLEFYTVKVLFDLSTSRPI
jgi:hypothetical protein